MHAPLLRPSITRFADTLKRSACHVLEYEGNNPSHMFSLSSAMILLQNSATTGSRTTTSWHAAPDPPDATAAAVRDIYDPVACPSHCSDNNGNHSGPKGGRQQNKHLVFCGWTEIDCAVHGGGCVYRGRCVSLGCLPLGHRET